MGNQTDPGQEIGEGRITNARCAEWIRGCLGASWGTPSNRCDLLKYNAEHVAANGAYYEKGLGPGLLVDGLLCVLRMVSMGYYQERKHTT